RCPEKITGPYEDDPAPTSLVPGAGYHKRYNRSRCWCRKWELDWWVEIGTAACSQDFWRLNKRKFKFFELMVAWGFCPHVHELAASAARSLAMGKCDVALVLGARLNWLLHFGEPLKWAKDVNFVLVDICKEEIDMRKLSLV
ncbi:unnamed protein product, partial [Ilex paraguariensis]